MSPSHHSGRHSGSLEGRDSGVSVISEQSERYAGRGRSSDRPPTRESATTLAEILSIRRAKKECQEAESPRSPGIDASFKPNLCELDAKIDKSLDHLSDILGLVTSCSSRLEVLQRRSDAGQGPFPGRGASKTPPAYTGQDRQDSKTLPVLARQDSKLALGPVLNRQDSKTLLALNCHDTASSQLPRVPQDVPLGDADSEVFREEVPESVLQRSEPTMDRIYSTRTGISALSRGNSSRSIGTMGSTMEVFSDLSGIFRRGRRRSKVVECIWDYMNESAVFLGTVRIMVLMSVFVSLLHKANEQILAPILVYLTILVVFFDAVFLLEISVRCFICPSRIRFFYSFFNLIDLFAGFVPPICRALVGFRVPDEDGQAISMRNFLLCVVPILRLFKLLRSFDSFQLLLKAFRLAFEALPVLLFTYSIIVLFFSTLIFMVEPRSNLDSYPRALWLTIVTTSTVGYGDEVPETVGGYIIVSCLTVISALYMAIPIGIVGNAFSSVWQDRDRLLLTHRLRERLLTMGYSANDVPALFHAFDGDSDGELNLREFTDKILAMDIGIGDERTMELFGLFDRDQSGGIDDEEFVRNLFPESYARIYLQIKASDSNEYLDAALDGEIIEDSHGASDSKPQSVDNSYDIKESKPQSSQDMHGIIDI